MCLRSGFRIAIRPSKRMASGIKPDDVDGLSVLIRSPDLRGINDGATTTHFIRSGSFTVRLAPPLAGILPILQINRVTRVYRAHVSAALTRPLARRPCRLRPPLPSPAPCRACDGRARRSHRPALASRRYW